MQCEKTYLAQTVAGSLLRRCRRGNGHRGGHEASWTDTRTGEPMMTRWGKNLQVIAGPGWSEWSKAKDREYYGRA